MFTFRVDWRGPLDIPLEELVALGLRIEQLERPAAKQRMRDGGQRGAEVTNNGVSSAELTPDPDAGRAF